MSRRVHIVIAEPSLIIRSGMVSVLHRLLELNVDIAEISDMEMLTKQISKYNPDILIIAPMHIGGMSVQSIKAEIGFEGLKIIALQNSLSDSSVLKQFDGIISIYDSSDTIKDILIKSIDPKQKTEIKQELSTREKEIVVCIVRGMTNKQIAEKLFLSIHTVITHRRNIASKLQIHSPSGLTIYAIVSKLIEIDEVKNSIFPQT